MNTMFHKALSKLCYILGNLGKPLTYTELKKMPGKDARRCCFITMRP